MKRISPAVLLLCMSTAVPAMAAPANDPNAIPAYQLGSGHRAGGPASELISPTGGPIPREALRANSSAQRAGPVRATARCSERQRGAG